MPKINFNIKVLAAVKPPTDKAQVDYWDQALPQFGMRVSSSGRRTWCLFYRFKGRQRRFTIASAGQGGLGLGDAKKQAYLLLGQIAVGIDPASTRRNERDAKTFSALASFYIAWAEANKRSWKADKNILLHDLEPQWGHLKITAIEKRDVRVMIDGISNRGAKVQANRVFSLARRIFNFAIEHDLLMINPCQRMKKPFVETSRERVLSHEETRKLWHCLPSLEPIYGDIIRLGLLTAQRPGEVRAMRWADINLDERIWTIPAEMAKNSRSHRVYLTSSVLEILSRRKQDTAGVDWVFPSLVRPNQPLYDVKPGIIKARILV